MTTTRVGRTPDEPDDERHLYGDPQHEVGADIDPKEMYGTAQHDGTATSGVKRFWLDCRAFRKSVPGQFR